jgi:hypothetical protein
MSLSTASCRIDEVLNGVDRPSQQAVMLFDRYAALLPEDRDSLVAALIHRLLLERARNRLTDNIPPNQSIH